MSTLKYNTWLNTDNTENYKCRAWVNFNGTGTVAIRASGNVSSITDNGTGDYTINFSTAMPDINYGYYVTGREDTNGSADWAALPVPYRTAQTTSAFRVTSRVPNAGGAYDANSVSFAAFR